MQIIWLSHQGRTILLLQCTHTWKGAYNMFCTHISTHTHISLGPLSTYYFCFKHLFTTPSTSSLVCSNILVGGGCGWLYCTSLWCLDLIEPKLAFTFTSTCSFLVKTFITPKHDFHDLDNLRLLSNYNHIIIFKL